MNDGRLSKVIVGVAFDKVDVVWKYCRDFENGKMGRDRDAS